jgi:uncharacterized membrane protein
VYNTTVLYEIIDAYRGFAPHWQSQLRSERFGQPDGTDVVPLLYRPDIVHDIHQKIGSILKGKTMKGLLITGPQGIGKSFSLVNTVIHLESTGDYLVTFLPDGDVWQHVVDLVDAIAFSIGTNRHAIPEMNKAWISESESFIDLSALIDVITNFLAHMSQPKHWVFVF